MSTKPKRRSDDLGALEEAAEAYRSVGIVGGKPCSVPVEKLDLTQNIRDVDKESLGFISLKESIQTEGLLQRPSVIKIGDEKLQCVGGHRRIAALIELGYETIPCILHNIDPSDSKKIELIKLAENVVREDLAPLELADAVLKAKVDLDETATGLGRVLRKDRKYISRLLKIAGWPKNVRTYIAKENVPLKSLFQIAAKSVPSSDVLSALKDIESSRLTKKGATKSKHAERREAYFEKKNLSPEHRKVVLEFLRENRVTGWF